MKKIILVLLMMFPIILNADVNKESCKLIKGTGHDIGDEVECVGESFYIVDVSEDDLVLMSKYNIMTNGYCDLYSLDGEYDTLTQALPAIEAIHGTLNYDKELVIPKTNSNNKVVGYKYCKFGEYEQDRIYKQDKDAIGFRGQLEHLLFPYKGLIAQNDDIINHNYEVTKTYNEVFNDIQLGEDSDQSKILKGYENYLNSKNVNFKSIKMPTLESTATLINKISNNRFDLSSFTNSDNWQEVNGIDSETGIESSHIVVSDIKPYISDNYKWIYSTSYWLNTLDSIKHSRFFVITLGEVCVSDICDHPALGIRPLVVVPKSIRYIIKTKTDGKGTIDVVDSAAGGESISFVTTANKGLELVGVTITTDSGERVEFTQKDIKEDENGIKTIKTNLFTMPFENVLIEASWRETIVNPKTGVNYLVMILISLLASLVGFIILSKNNIIKDI